MRKVIFALLLIILLFSLTSCDWIKIVEVYPTETKIGLPVSENWEYLDLFHLPGYPGEHTEAIGNAIYKWEVTHPNREIVSMQIIFLQNAYSTQQQLMGISIYSKLK